MGRHALDVLRDLLNAEGPAFVPSWREGEMNVVWHYDKRMQLKTVPVAAKAGLHDDIARKVRKDPAPGSGKGDEENLIVGLEVRKFATVVVLALHKFVISGLSVRTR